MQRRRFLAALGAAALAGCSFRSDGDDEREPTLTPAPLPADTGTPTPTRRPGPVVPRDEPEASITTSEPTGRTFSLFPTRYHGPDGGIVTLEFLAPATADHPARVRATLHNDNPFRNVFRLREFPPFGEVTTATLNRESRMFLSPTESHPLAERSPEVERNPSGGWNIDTDPQGWLPETHALGPGDSVTGEYAVVGERTGTDPMGVGTYRFGDVGGPLHDEGFSVAVWRTDAPGPEGESRFEGVRVPALPGDAETVWFHESGPGTERYLRPERERAALPVALPVEFVNHSTRMDEAVPDFRLYKLHEGSWYALDPARNERFDDRIGYRVLYPGSSFEWTLRARSDRVLPSHAPATRDESFVGGGRYAVTALVADANRRVAALFDLDGPQAVVAPSRRVTVERGDSVVRVRLANVGEGSPVVRVSRAPEAIPDRTVIAEQVMEVVGLRNTLAFFDEGVESVRTRVPEHVVQRLFRVLTGDYESTGPTVVGFRGGRYRFETADGRDTTRTATQTPVE